MIDYLLKLTYLMAKADMNPYKRSDYAKQKYS